MSTVLITGSNRGIGLGLVKYFLNHSDPPKILIATCRNPDNATELQELKKKNINLHLLQLGEFLQFFKRILRKLNGKVLYQSLPYFF